MPRPRSLVVAALGIGAVAVALTGCASSPGTVPPRGVDQLVVPTPSPDPDDFVDTVDNVWFPLEPGSEQRWGVPGDPGDGLRLSVLEERRNVAGVEATVVRTAPVGPAGAVPAWPSEPGTDYYAQDEDGNVWWLGHEGQWEAGVDGAEAGMVVPADPRTGDGYWSALLPGVVEDRAEVLLVDGDDLVIERTAERGSATVHLERGRGPVRVEAAGGSVELLQTDPPATPPAD